MDRDPLTKPITIDDIRRIATELGDPDRILRSQLATLAFADLATRLEELLHQERKEPDDPVNANFWSFLTWTSRTIARNIRYDRPEWKFGERRALLRELLVPIALNSRAASHPRAVTSLAEAQLRVFWEMGIAGVLFVDTMPKLVVKRDKVLKEGGLSPFDFAMDSDEDGKLILMEKIRSATQKIYDKEFLIKLGELIKKDPPASIADEYDPAIDPSFEDRLASLKAAFDPYRRMIVEAPLNRSPRKARAEYILQGNVLLDAHEQSRVQDGLDSAFSDLAAQAVDWLEGGDTSQKGRAGRRLSKRLTNLIRPALEEAWARFLTQSVYVVRLDDEVIRIGQDLRPLPSGYRFPPDLRDLHDAGVRKLVGRYDRSYRNGSGTAAEDWRKFDDRMNFIVNYMRSRQQSLPSASKAFSPNEERRLLGWKVPWFTPQDRQSALLVLDNFVGWSRDLPRISGVGPELGK